DGLPVGVRAALLHVGQVGLVGLNARRRRRVRLVLAGREAAPRALPLVGDRGIGRETRPGLVPVGAPERHPHAGRGLTALRLAHRAGAYPATANRITTTHRIPPLRVAGCRAYRPAAAMTAWLQWSLLTHMREAGSPGLLSFHHL